MAVRKVGKHESECCITGTHRGFFNNILQQAVFPSRNRSVHHFSASAPQLFELHIADMGIPGSVNGCSADNQIRGHDHDQPGCDPLNRIELSGSIFRISSSAGILFFYVPFYKKHIALIGYPPDLYIVYIHLVATVAGPLRLNLRVKAGLLSALAGSE